MSLIEKIDELEKHLVKNNSYFEGAEWLFGKVREAILSEQKNATEHDGCDGCLHEEKTNEEYPCNHCKQCYIDQWKPKLKPTIGDKIRESNEGLAEFINRLSAYEDTGLTPEEIQELQADRDYWKAEALKHCAKLGEIKLLVGRTNG